MKVTKKTIHRMHERLSAVGIEVELRDGQVSDLIIETNINYGSGLSSDYRSFRVYGGELAIAQLIALLYDIQKEIEDVKANGEPSL